MNQQERNRIAEYVKEQNLQKVNEISKEVHLRNTIYVRYIKRILDVIISFAAILVTLPINVVLGVCTFFDVGRPIFFKQKRPGKDGKLFTIVKFRNMREALDENGDWLPVSQRVTKFGTFVRRTSLDELLNFYSVLRGDMSLIGPRPLAELYWDRYSNRHRMRHSVRPGLECPDLFSRGYAKGWHAQFENDIWYVENVSFITDCKLLALLFLMVFDRKTRSEHANTGVGDFIGYDENGIAFGANSIPEKYTDMLTKEMG